MTAKLQSYIQLAGRIVAQLTKNPKNWVVFLKYSITYLYDHHIARRQNIWATQPVYSIQELDMEKWRLLGVFLVLSI